MPNTDDVCPVEKLQELPDSIFRLVTQHINRFQLVNLYQKQGEEHNYLVNNPLSNYLSIPKNNC